MLRGVAPDNGRAARPTAARVEFVCVWNPRQPGSLGISRDEAESLGLSLSHSQRTTPKELLGSSTDLSLNDPGLGQDSGFQASVAVSLLFQTPKELKTPAQNELSQHFTNSPNSKHSTLRMVS